MGVIIKILNVDIFHVYESQSLPSEYQLAYVNLFCRLFEETFLFLDLSIVLPIVSATRFLTLLTSFLTLSLIFSPLIVSRAIFSTLLIACSFTALPIAFPASD